MNKPYTVTVREVVSYTVEVFASSEDEAGEIAIACVIEGDSDFNGVEERSVSMVQERK